MKWIIFLLILFVVGPFFGDKLAASAKARVWAVTWLAFDLFNPSHINLISQEQYRGDSRGIEITSVDIVVYALWLAGRQKPTSRAPATRHIALRCFYLAMAVLSLRESPDALKSIFSIWKIVRMYFFFDVLATALLDMRLVAAATQGLALGMLAQGALAFQQKYIFHAIRVSGSLPHPNSLAMLSNLLSPIAFSLWLSGRGTRVVVPVYGLAGICVIVSLSRGGMMMFAMATVLGSAVSFARGLTPRKLKVLGGVVVSGALVLARSMDTIIERFTTAPKESEEARKLFNAAAKMMAAEHPTGVGINMYSWVLDKGGYADRLHIEPGDRNGIAHHVYWLTTAELGYGGITAYLLLLAAVYVSCIRAARLGGLRGDIGVGMTIGLTTMYLQGTAEWIPRQTPMAYAFWLFAALASALRGMPKHT